jgi:hypothetical protein
LLALKTSELLDRVRFSARAMPRNPALPIAELQAQFHEKGQVAIVGALPVRETLAMDRAARSARFRRVAVHPNAHRPGAPSHMFYERAPGPHRLCTRSCAALCAFVKSLSNGALRSLARDVTSLPRLTVSSIRVRAYVKGSHVDAEGAVEKGDVAVFYCATLGSDPVRAGSIRFGEGGEIVPEVGVLYLRRTILGESSSMDLVIEHGPLVWITANMVNGHG